jgi:hypothetical protein
VRGISAHGPKTTELRVGSHVGDRAKSGRVVLTVSFVAGDPNETLLLWSLPELELLRQQLAVVRRWCTSVRPSAPCGWGRLD